MEAVGPKTRCSTRLPPFYEFFKAGKAKISSSESLDRVLAVIPGEKLVPKVEQSVLPDRFPDPLHQAGQKIEVVIRGQSEAENLVGFDEMADIGPRVTPARVASALRIQGRKIPGIPGVSHHQSPLAGHGGAVSGDPGGEHAVKHVDSADDSLDQGIGRSHPHQI